MLRRVKIRERRRNKGGRVSERIVRAKERADGMAGVEGVVEGDVVGSPLWCLCP